MEAVWQLLGMIVSVRLYWLLMAWLGGLGVLEGLWRNLGRELSEGRHETVPNRTSKANLANRSLGTSPFFMSNIPTKPLDQNSMHLDLEKDPCQSSFPTSLKSR
jgi:hypothetical protein